VHALTSRLIAGGRVTDDTSVSTVSEHENLYEIVVGQSLVERRSSAAQGVA
jgi:hypothetical protein